ncbi:proton-coupled zinc antiporter SLC30A2 isoform X2 [Anabrus simplex]|uniref:proton-coupled zinc antiporter SLC30A2 isoform X2 n=1 Tax=Anabrus simplex TaxID=316456 RepID=UPI0034DD666F
MCEERWTLTEGSNPPSFKHHAVYGSSLSYSPPTDAANGSATRIIYCVHGKPSGCCLTPEGDIIDKSGIIVSPERRDSYSTSGEHCHRVSREERVDQKARRKLIIASILCVIFMIGEVIGGYLSSSLAIATDAAHLLTDFASFMISLFSLWVASRPATRRMSFGWYRAEVIGALTSVLMIWVITGILVYMAIERIVTDDYDIDAEIMLITSAIGVAVNLVMGLTLHQHGHSHGGGRASSHSHEGESGGSSHSHEQNINVRAAFIHVVGDFIQSFGVFLAALVIYYKPTWIIIDPICTFLFSILVLITTFAIIKDTLLVLMEGMPRGIDFSEVLNTLLQIDGVVRVHNLRIWALSLDKTALAAHLAIRPGVNPQKILTEASRNIHLKFAFFEMTLQIEEFDAEMEQCTQCKCPDD